jgi:NAD(P)H-dependent FMN reductase
MTFHPKTLVLFVHGFLGSESSFVSFPLDLIQAIRTLYKIPNLEARLFPFFSTKGDPNKSVHLLYNWLILNATQPEYEAVIIVCHSMGGLIAVEAVSKLQQFQKGEEVSAKTFEVASANLDLGDLNRKNSNSQLKEPLPEKVESKGWFSGWFSTETKKIDTVEDTLQSMPVEEDQPTELEVSLYLNPSTKSYVNVASIICFDSPFNGLNPTVFTVAAGDQAADIISSYIPSGYSDTVNSTIKYGNKLAKTAVVGSINAVASLPQATTSAIKSVSTLPGTIYSSLPTASEALTATTTPIRAIPGAIAALPGVLSAGATYAAAAPGAVSSSISYLWPWRNNSKSDEPSMLISESDRIPPSDRQDSQDTLNEETSTEISKQIEELKVDVQDIRKEELVPIEDSRPELLPIPQDSDWSPWISLGITTAAVAGGAYYFTGSLLAISTMTVVRRVALAYAVSHAEEARQRLQFLYPIWGESSKNSLARLQFLKENTEKSGLLFKCYYIEVIWIHLVCRRRN